jgi:cytochrome c556
MVLARIRVMKANAKSVYGDLNKIVKGTRPYDQAVVDAALAQLQDASGKIESLYPASTKGLKAPNDEYSASAISGTTSRISNRARPALPK